MSKDPFLLYEDVNISDYDEVALKELTHDQNLRARLKQMILDMRLGLNDEGKECSSLQEIENAVDKQLNLGTSTGSEQERHKEDNEVGIDSDLVSIHDGPEVRVNISYRNKIGSEFSKISDTFTQIFQSLWFLICNRSDDFMDSVQKDKFNKKTRDFEIRMNRLIFQLKQKVKEAKASVLRLGLNTGLKSRQDKAYEDLVKAQKCAHNLLKTFHCHLSKLGFLGFPIKVIAKLSIELMELHDIAEALGFECQDFRHDIKRLKSAETKFGNADNHAATPIKEVEQEKKKKKTVNMINNLAREKFGIPISPKKTNLRKQKVIIPKGNRILKQKIDMAKLRRCASEPQSDSLTETESVGQSRINEFFIGRKSDSCQNAVSETKKEKNNSPLLLTLENDELSQILKYRRESIQSQFFTNRFQLSNPTKFISDLSEEICRDIIANICREVTNAHIIEEILEREIDT